MGFLGNNPERARQTAPNAELLRQYYEVVMANFAMLHECGYLSDPAAILAGMGVTREAVDRTEAPVTEQSNSVYPMPTQFKHATAEVVEAPVQTTVINGIDVTAALQQANEAALSRNEYDDIAA